LSPLFPYTTLFRSPRRRNSASDASGRSCRCRPLPYGRDNPDPTFAMNEQPRLSRRAAFSSVASGLVLGAVWGATFPIVASESRPSIAIVGHRGAQLVLIDSGKARALVFLGDP